MTDMRTSALLVVLTLNTFCAFSQIDHEVDIFVGCFDNGTTEVQTVFDREEVFYIDFQKEEVVYTVPAFLMLNPEEIFGDIHIYHDAMKGKKACSAVVAYCKAEEKNPPEQEDPPESILYPAEEVQMGVENTLICFVNHFYPPFIEVSWTKNGRPVSEGVSLSRYYANTDQTFRQFSTLTFTPSEGDIYTCTVEHLALERPKTRIWEPDFSHQSLESPDVVCGVGLTVGFVGFIAGTFLIAKGCHGK